ncbi:MAG: hypothetical protein Q8730_02310 [Sweet potato little leaf phytoplasma]|nr:hypothetical protein [Sweet potato little leaf phytoplasma]
MVSVSYRVQLLAIEICISLTIKMSFFHENLLGGSLCRTFPEFDIELSEEKVHKSKKMLHRKKQYLSAWFGRFNNVFSSFGITKANTN